MSDFRPLWGGGSLQLKDLGKTLQFLIKKNPFFVERISIQYVRP